MAKTSGPFGCCALVADQPVGEFRCDGVDVLGDRLVGLVTVDDEPGDVGVEQVSDDLDQRSGLGVELGRRVVLLRRAPGDLLPLRLQAFDVAGEFVLGDALRGGADDDAGVLGNDPVHDRLQPLALGVGQLAGDTGGAAAGHVDHEPAGQRDLGGQPGALVADRVLRHLSENGVAAGQRRLDPPGLAVQAGGVPVHLAGVDDGIAATADVDERRLHRRQDILHLAQEHAADHRIGPGLRDEVLDQDAVLEQRDLRQTAALTHGHHPLDGLPPGQELGLGEDLRTAARGIPGIAAALPLRLEPGGSANALHLVGGAAGASRRGLREPRLADVHDGVVGIVLARGLIAVGPATPTPTPPVAAACLTVVAVVVGVVVGVVLAVGVATRFRAGVPGLVGGRRVHGVLSRPSSVTLGSGVVGGRLPGVSGGAVALLIICVADPAASAAPPAATAATRRGVVIGVVTRTARPRAAIGRGRTGVRVGVGVGVGGRCTGPGGTVARCLLDGLVGCGALVVGAFVGAVGRSAATLPGPAASASTGRWAGVVVGLLLVGGPTVGRTGVGRTGVGVLGHVGVGRRLRPPAA